MDQHPKHQEPIRQATAQFPEGQYAHLLTYTEQFLTQKKKRLIVSKHIADQWRWEEIDAGNWVFKNAKTLKRKRLFSVYKVLCAIVNCHQ